LSGRNFASLGAKNRAGQAKTLSPYEGVSKPNLFSVSRTEVPVSVGVRRAKAIVGKHTGTSKATRAKLVGDKV
jgi:hypothetical protein